MTQTINTKITNSSGMIAFTSLLIISAVTLAIATSISLLGVNEARNSLDVKRSTEALKISDSCIEEAIYRLKSDSTFTGATLNVGNGQCSMSITGSGGDRTIISTGTINGTPYTRKVQAGIKFTGGGAILRSRSEIP